MEQLNLNTPVEFLKGVGPDKALLLGKELNIFTFEDLLFHYPFRYVDKSTILPISAVQEGMHFVQLMGRIERVQTLGEGHAKRMQAILRDNTGTIELVWFKSLKWIQRIVLPGSDFIVFGKPASFNGKFNIVHPELELATKEATNFNEKAKLDPVYSTTEKLKARGLESKNIAKLVKQVVEKVDNLPENLPQHILDSYKMLPRTKALKQIHFPQSAELQKAAENRLKFEELFFIQVKLLRQRNKRRQEIQGHVFDKVGEKFNTFYTQYLPFELTNAQKRVIKEIRADVRTGKQMNRLVQGDVGSGKTVVALMCMLLALDNGTQACLMAPTEILAAQHFQNIHYLLKDMDIHVKLLTGSTKAKERKKITEDLAHGSLDIIIGTHALLEKWVSFPNLGLVVIDEQHRFGVAQRATMWAKNKIPPHILVMTATPIPRTLAMTLYGDLENSVIDELPPGRKEIETKHAFESARLKIFGFMKEQIALGRQVYVVYPLIEESETLDYKNLMEGYEAISREFPRPQYQIGIVHGQMKAEDKEAEMQRFKKGITNILVSTTVIEVGVDVPNATVMVIESAERFGLSQLHQLRGRVGRGGNKSYCILMTGYKLGDNTRTRIETMVRTNNGFEIAEVDLRLRGPGDMTGTQQSGMLNLKIANLAADQKILVAARHAAMEILDKDPNLELPEHRPIINFVNQKSRNQPNWSLIS
ncbi:MAG: ATP-dependent DNA helicase RecG [Bacteroidia bacterium]